MQTIYCNWRDAEEPRKWRVTSGEKKSRAEARPLQKSGGRAAAAPRNSREGSKTKSRAKKNQNPHPENRGVRRPAMSHREIMKRLREGKSRAGRAREII